MNKKMLLSVLVSLFFLSSFAQSEWKLAKNKEEIKVYTRKVEGSQILECKAKVLVNATPQELFAVLKDVKNQKNWMDRIAKSQLLKDVSANEWFAYYEVSAPWPVSNRDVASKYIVQKNTEDKVVIKVIAVPDYRPVQDGKVRIQKSITVWTFSKIDDNTSQVTYQSHSEPGGKLPDWLANSASTDNPFNTMKGLRSLVK